jgi:hypothetical protein
LLPDRFGYPFEIGKEERMLHGAVRRPNPPPSYLFHEVGARDSDDL